MHRAKVSENRIKSVFIGGAPRSGTTMLGAILGTHSQTLTSPETQFKFQLSPLFKQETKSLEEIYNALLHNQRFRVWKFNIAKEKISVNSIEDFLLTIIAEYGVSVNKSYYNHWIDTTPVNLKHASFLLNEFPDCLFIHIVRDGRGVFASQKKLDWGSNDPIFAALKWIEGICPGFVAELAFPKKCIRVHYEDILLDPEKEIRRLCSFIGIDFEDSMIEGSGFKVPSYTKSQHMLVGQKPDPSRIQDWKQTLSENEIRHFETMTYDLLDMLGYDRINQGILKKPSDLAQARIMMGGALKYLTINKWKNKRRLEKHSSRLKSE